MTIADKILVKTENGQACKIQCPVQGPALTQTRPAKAVDSCPLFFTLRLLLSPEILWF
ncbi:hypothetical protein SCA6_002622 [Theobroma cacao]